MKIMFLLNFKRKRSGILDTYFMHIYNKFLFKNPMLINSLKSKSRNWSGQLMFCNFLCKFDSKMSEMRDSLTVFKNKFRKIENLTKKCVNLGAIKFNQISLTNRIYPVHVKMYMHNIYIA